MQKIVKIRILLNISIFCCIPALLFPRIVIFMVICWIGASTRWHLQQNSFCRIKPVQCFVLFFSHRGRVSRMARRHHLFFRISNWILAALTDVCQMKNWNEKKKQSVKGYKYSKRNVSYFQRNFFSLVSLRYAEKRENPRVVQRIQLRISQFPKIPVAKQTTQNTHAEHEEIGAVLRPM